MSDLLLPPNATAWELALEQTSAERHPLPTETLRAFFNPDACPKDLLTWLAHEASVDLWDDAWTVERKRAVIKGWFQAHRTKGTRAGIAAAVALTDSRVAQDVTFPSRAFASAAITREQRDAWLARMPEIRIYFTSQKAPRGPAGHMRAEPPAAGRASYAGRAFARFDAAEAIYGRRSLLRRADGTEQPLRHATITVREGTAGRETVDRVRIPGEAGAASFTGQGFTGQGFLHRGKTPPKTATVRVEGAARPERELHWQTLRLGFEPVDMEYRVRSERHPAGPAAMARRFARGRFLLRDMAAERIFQGIYLHDPSVDAPWTRAHSFVGHARTPKPPFRSEMLVEAFSRAGRRSAFAGRSFSGRQHVARSDLAKLRFALLAGRTFKATRDRLSFDTKTRRSLRFTDSPRLDGTISFRKSVRRTL